MLTSVPPQPVFTSAKPVRARPPRTWPIQPAAILAVLVGNGLLIVGIWVRHGGIDLLGTTQANLTAIGQLTALLGTYAALVQLVLMARSPWLEHVVGMGRLAHWHRWLGFSCVTLICGHVLFSTVGYALGSKVSVLAEAGTLLTTYPYMIMATLATGLLILVALTSIRAARMRMKYETWQFVHLYAYLAIALAFGHELAVGYDFSNDRLAVAYWIALYAAALGLILAFRVGHPVAMNMRHRLRIARVVQEAPETVSIYVTGRDLGELRSRAGQFFKWRFLSGSGWWKPHPWSLSAAPNDHYLRITVKVMGDGSREVQNLPTGTRVIAEGPYGIFTAAKRTRPRTVLIAGGVGITAIRALLEELPGGKGTIVLLYFVRRPEDILFRAEIDALVASRRGIVHYVVDDPDRRVHGSPLSPKALRQRVPDVGQREVFICGPLGLIRELHESLRALNVADEHIHDERFALL